MAHSTEAGDLVRALAVELAFFTRPADATGRRHVGLAGMPLCNGDPVFAVRNGCSPRCTRVRAALESAARWLGCEIDDFYPKPKAKKRKAAG